MEAATAIGDEGGIAIAFGEKKDDVDVPPMVMASQADVERPVELTANAFGDIACRLGHCADQSHMHAEIRGTARAMVSHHW